MVVPCVILDQMHAHFWLLTYRLELPSLWQACTPMLSRLLSSWHICMPIWSRLLTCWLANVLMLSY